MSILFKKIYKIPLYAIFVSNLFIGSNGQEVYNLQKILNQDPETVIAQSGPGSPGNETTYFGNLTKEAVIRFQEKFRNEILVPAGLSSGNGFVGSLTRNKLNSFATETSPTNLFVSPSTQPNNNQEKQNELIDRIINGIFSTSTFTRTSTTTNEQPANIFIGHLSNTKLKAGDKLSIFGAVYDLNPVPYINNEPVKDYKIVNVNQIDINLPKKMEEKIYVLKLVDENGEGSVSNEVSFTIVPQNAPIPSIEKVNSETLEFNKKITLTGKNLKGKLRITTVLGMVEVENNKEDAVEFMIPRPNVPVTSAPLELDGYIIVSNEYGTSNALMIKSIAQ